MVEWSNPIFYLNIVGLAASALLLRRSMALRRNRRTDGGWFWPSLVLVAGTGLHFVGDLFNYSEEQDHIFIHAVIGLALVVAFFRPDRSPA